MPADRGFEEIPHTADRAMRVWAPDLAGLFAEAVRGMHALSGTRTDAEPAIIRTFEASASDPESLLVAFLSELIFSAEQERLAFDRVRSEVFERAEGWALKAGMEGRRILSADKAIKAVTYHKMRIGRTKRGCEVEIVFDV